MNHIKPRVASWWNAYKILLEHGSFAAGIKTGICQRARLKLRVGHRDSWACRSCGTVCGVMNGTVDHIIPRVKGGASFCERNMQWMCYRCNQDKGAKLPPAGMGMLSPGLPKGKARKPDADPFALPFVHHINH